MSRKGSTARFVNGVISAVLVVLFLAHGVLGSASLVTGFSGTFQKLVWVGMALVAAHVIASVVTSRQQLADAERPPSARKKRHLALKWATGAVLAACVAVHVLVDDPFASRMAIVALAVALAVHLCVGAKSLLKDVGANRRYKMAFRVAVCGFAALFATAALATLALST